MPLYEYQCNNCGKSFEQIVRFSESGSAPACPFCKAENTHKKISAAASFRSTSSGAFSSGGSCESGGGFT